jgi:TPP-dependent trihydroxycyclohexane-1,2-dione (THcHDO) dehydratase
MKVKATAVLTLPDANAATITMGQDIRADAFKTPLRFLQFRHVVSKSQRQKAEIFETEFSSECLDFLF